MRDIAKQPPPTNKTIPMFPPTFFGAILWGTSLYFTNQTGSSQFTLFWNWEQFPLCALSTGYPSGTKGKGLGQVWSSTSSPPTSPATCFSSTHGCLFYIKTITLPVFPPYSLFPPPRPPRPHSSSALSFTHFHSPHPHLIITEPWNGLC